MSPDKHSLNAQVDQQVYLEYQFILNNSSPKLSVNRGTEEVLKEYVEKWKKKNRVETIPVGKNLPYKQ